ncbi:hypothetical protein LU692_10925 [Pseudomonas sp. NMI795_08]|nr:hypothetical protein [Pseudomonas sp. NMI795_08]
MLSGFHLASCRRFLGVNSVTNSGSGTGFLPVPIVRNEYWFEKIHIARFASASDLCRQNLITGSKG